jgi:hypothetical protein
MLSILVGDELSVSFDASRSDACIPRDLLDEVVGVLKAGV